jgi:hypothetical protein
MSENQREEDATLKSLPELDTVCTRCRGKWPDCYYCGGTGYTVTEFGEKVLAFILRHISLDAGSITKR